MKRPPLARFLSVASAVSVSTPAIAHDTGDDAHEPAAPVNITDHARAVHDDSIVIDGHNDLPWQLRKLGHTPFTERDLTQPQPDYHTDLPRLQAGGVDAQFWSAYVPVSTIEDGGALRFGLEQIDLIHRMIARYPEALELALTADDIERIAADGKVASLIGVEGGHAIEESLGSLRMMYDLGVRYLTLTHNDSLPWADAATDDPIAHGLSDFGRDVVAEMNRLGMLIDISHVSVETMHAVLDHTAAPVIASHSSAYAIAAHPRNVPDDVLKRLPDNGGVIMVNFYSGFVDPDAVATREARDAAMDALRAQHGDDREAFRAARAAYRQAHPMPRGTVDTVVDHIDHIVKVAGIDHVGLGSDYDGVGVLPQGLEDVSTFPNLTQALLNRGYTEDDVHQINGGNLLRAMREAEAVADASTTNP